MNAHIDVRDDHLLIRLDGMDGVAALRRSLLVPFSTIENADLEKPLWPRLGTIRIGAHVPGRLAVGSFRETGGRRRFLDIDRSTQRALRLQLKGHPEFDEVELATEEPERIVSEVARHRPPEMRIPPVYE